MIFTYSFPEVQIRKEDEIGLLLAGDLRVVLSQALSLPLALTRLNTSLLHGTALSSSAHSCQQVRGSVV